MNSEKFHFEKGLNYRIFHINSPTNKIDPILIPYPCIIYCTNGYAKIGYNTDVYTIKKDDIFCVFSNTTFKGIEVSDDMQGMVIMFSNDLILDSTIGFKAEYMANIFKQPCKTLSNPIIKDLFHGLFSVLDSYHEIEERFMRNTDFVYGMIRSILIVLAEISQEENSKHSLFGKGFSTTDSYFRDFLELLSTHCKTQHNVAFYADRLCITPKYLNEICRKKTKKHLLLLGYQEIRHEAARKSRRHSHRNGKGIFGEIFTNIYRRISGRRQSSGYDIPFDIKTHRAFYGG